MEPYPLLQEPHRRLLRHEQQTLPQSEQENQEVLPPHDQQQSPPQSEQQNQEEEEEEEVDLQEGDSQTRVLPLRLQVQIDHFPRDRMERDPGNYTTSGRDHPCGHCYTLGSIDHTSSVCFLRMILYGLVLPHSWLLPPGGHRLLIYLVYAAGLLKKPRIDYDVFSCVRDVCGLGIDELTNGLRTFTRSINICMDLFEMCHPFLYFLALLLYSIQYHLDTLLRVWVLVLVDKEKPRDILGGKMFPLFRLGVCPHLCRFEKTLVGGYR
jgi:hypothetical protein